MLYKLQTNPAVEELKQLMQLAKLQNPTRRQQKEEKQKTEKVEVERVKHENDGSVTVTKVNIIPFSSGRERFRKGTKSWATSTLIHLH